MHAPLIVIVGPTACGKTTRAVSAASAFGGEVISADSRQLYRGMDLGTGKDLSEYGSVPYHLIDIAAAGERCNLHQWLKLFHEAESDIRARGRVPILCGGTGMYAEAAVNGVQLPDVPENPALRERLKDIPLPELARMLAQMKTLHNVTDIDTAQRARRAIEIATYYQEHPEEQRLTVPKPRRDTVIVAVDIPREARRERISARLRERLDQGMVQEVRALIDSGVSPDDLIYYGLEYKYITLHVIGQIDYDTMVRQLEIAIHQFAKRQMTWLRGMERRGLTLHWLPYDMPEADFNHAIRRLCDSLPQQ